MSEHQYWSDLLSVLLLALVSGGGVLLVAKALAWVIVS